MAKLMRERFPSQSFIVNLPPNDFGIMSITLDCDIPMAVPIEIFVVGADPSGGKRRSFSLEIDPD